MARQLRYAGFQHLPQGIDFPFLTRPNAARTISGVSSLVAPHSSISFIVVISLSFGYKIRARKKITNRFGLCQSSRNCVRHIRSYSNTILFKESLEARLKFVL